MSVIFTKYYLILQDHFNNNIECEKWNKLLNWNVKGLHDEWHLLYKGNRDGFNAKDFHRLCDNKGPTITVIRTRQGKLFGFSK